jgi:hypothetical protein
MKVNDKNGVQIELDDCTVLQITLNKLREVYDWQSNYYIDTSSNKLLKTETFHTTHSWDTTSEVREATVDDYRFSAIHAKLVCRR